MRQTLFLAVLCALLPGCLERTETLTIAADGSITVEHEVVGDPADLDGGPARYPVGKGFAVTVEMHENADGDPEKRVLARASYASAADMPRHFGDAKDAFAARALAFTTEVTIREDAKGRVLRFVRTYKRRDRATYRHFWGRAFSKEIQAYIDDPDVIPSLPRAERRKLVAAVLDYQRMQMQYWAERALATVAPEAETLVDVQLSVAKEIARYFEKRVEGPALDRVLADPVERIEAFCENIQKAVRKIASTHAKAELGLGDADLARLALELHAEQHDFDVTHDLSDENFVVRLVLPGEVIGDNADERAGEVLVWRFHANDLDDRDHVLIATCRLP